MSFHRLYKCTYVRRNTCIDTHVQTRTRIHIHTHTSTFTHIFTHTRTHSVHTNIYAYYLYLKLIVLIVDAIVKVLLKLFTLGIHLKSLHLKVAYVLIVHWTVGNTKRL